ncbi:hypothetical protein OROMI_018435 [Orobanche minor]
MLMPPPPPLPGSLVIPLRHPKYIEVNKQLLVRPEKLNTELTLIACKYRIIYDPLFGSLIPKIQEDLLMIPSLRVHGTRLCFIDDDNNLYYLNHQNQKVLDEASRIQESEEARMTILEDLRLRAFNYSEFSLSDLAEIWYDDSTKDPIDFWIYHFLKHGYYAKNDPMLDRPVK